MQEDIKRVKTGENNQCGKNTVNNRFLNYGKYLEENGSDKQLVVAMYVVRF